MFAACSMSRALQYDKPASNLLCSSGGPRKRTSILQSCQHLALQHEGVYKAQKAVVPMHHVDYSTSHCSLFAHSDVALDSCFRLTKLRDVSLLHPCTFTCARDSLLRGTTTALRPLSVMLLHSFKLRDRSAVSPVSTRRSPSVKLPLVSFRMHKPLRCLCALQAINSHLCIGV